MTPKRVTLSSILWVSLILVMMTLLLVEVVRELHAQEWYSAGATLSVILLVSLALRYEVRQWLSSFDLSYFHNEKAKWSLETFGPGDRYSGVVSHIREELKEIEEDPSSLEEWVDVILLAMDGAWRSAGADGDKLVKCLVAKQNRNQNRTWPDWRTLKTGEVSKHIGEG